MKPLTLSTEYISSFVKEQEILSMQAEVFRHRDTLMQGKGPGADFLGWIRLPSGTKEGILHQVNSEAARLAGMCEVIVVIGIGGSYLGTRAVIEALQDPLRRKPYHLNTKTPEILYAGHHLSSEYMHALMSYLQDKEVGLIVISKSGTTTEPAMAFRLLKAMLEHRYGKQQASRRIIAITDASRGALRLLTNAEGYASFVIPDDVGGRYSVLTPVGLVPIAAAGYDIGQLVAGAAYMEEALASAGRLQDHPAGWYAAARQLLYRQGRPVEISVTYEPGLLYLLEWWKQLYGESEGKDRKGIFPASVGFTTDLHSMGQYIQDGLRVIFETVLRIAQPRQDLILPADQEDLDGLNFLARRGFDEVNRTAAQGTLLAHVDGGVPNLQIELTRLDEYHLGALLYFYEMGCAISGYMLEVNPFDQPGVEDYKRNMFALLGKPGFEALAATLRQRLG